MSRIYCDREVIRDKEAEVSGNMSQSLSACCLQSNFEGRIYHEQRYCQAV